MVDKTGLKSSSSQINLTSQSQAFRNNGPGALTSLNRPVNNSNSLAQPVRNCTGPFESLQSNPIRYQIGLRQGHNFLQEKKLK